MFGVGSMLARYAATWRICHAMALSVWVSINPGAIRQKNADDIANAIATAVAEDPAPLWGDARKEAATMADWGAHESNLREDVVGDGGKSFGVWQQKRACGRGDLVTQARCWLVLLHESAQWCHSEEAGLRALSSGSCWKAGKLVSTRMREVDAVLGN